MTTIDDALVGIPEGLRLPLIEEYRAIETNYLQHHWAPSEMSGGRFCEIVYTIVHGHLTGNYKQSPEKPDNFVQACRALESIKVPPRSFQILIPRVLPALYEVRNNRGVGHVGGDVDPNAMDASFVMATSSWIISELIRFYHGVSTEDATKITANITEIHVPMIWKVGDKRRILKVGLPIPEQVLILVSMSNDQVSISDISDWTDYKNKSYLRKIAKQLHVNRLVEYTEHIDSLAISPTGARSARVLIHKYGLA